MINKAILIGNLGRDPQVRDVGETCTARLSLATSRRNKDKEVVTDWHSVVVWGRTAEIVRDYCQKGDRLYIEGRMQTSKYTDQQGIERYRTEVVANTVQMLTTKKERDAHVNEKAQHSQQTSADPMGFDDDAPF